MQLTRRAATALVALASGSARRPATAAAPAARAALSTAAAPSMPAVALRSGSMPLLGLGTWESSAGDVGAAVMSALGAGVRHIDCAAAYRNEKEIGAALAASAVPRREIWLTSKLWNDRRRPADVRAALERTLTSLRTDYLDLYLIHWPVVWAKGTVMRADEGASLRETWRTLEVRPSTRP